MENQRTAFPLVLKFSSQISSEELMVFPDYRNSLSGCASYSLKAPTRTLGGHTYYILLEPSEQIIRQAMYM